MPTHTGTKPHTLMHTYTHTHPHVCTPPHTPTHCTHHTEPQLLPLQVGQVPALQAGQVVLQAGVGVGVAVGELVDVVLPVEAEGEGHDVVAPVVGAAVVVHVFGGEPLPGERQDESTQTLKKNT